MKTCPTKPGKYWCVWPSNDQGQWIEFVDIDISLDLEGNEFHCPERYNKMKTLTEHQYPLSWAQHWYSMGFRFYTKQTKVQELCYD